MWVNKGHTSSRSWVDIPVSSLSSLSTRLKIPSSKGKWLIILHIGGDSAFLDDGSLIFQSGKTGDYNKDVSGEAFQKCFQNILPKLKQHDSHTPNKLWQK
jgi:hypothetical protein